MHLVKRFVSYYKPHRKLFAIDMACAFIVAVCDLFYPIIAGNIIDDYVPNQNLRLLLIWSGVLLGIYLVKAVLNYVIQYWGRAHSGRHAAGYVPPYAEAALCLLR